MASNKPTVNETQILESFLLSRASLKDIITFREFVNLFPKDKRSNPQIKLLYRELQLARNRQCTLVRNNILREARVGPKPNKREQGPDEDAMAGIELYGAAPEQPMLPLKDLLREMTKAAEDLESEEATLDNECDRILGQIRTIVGDLSDLRYGKLAASNTAEQVTREINHLVEICERTI
ncbi:hypothetical protein K440DRAFT_658019 [Wilcoxina mikolae CBS 423.85]|nr:hypothetical protein K440DRAFT_658019 [Wilcoxina mikolae CBS 423.85]